MSEVYTDWIRPASQINLIVEEEILPCVRIQVTHHFFWWRGWLFPRAKKSQRSCSLAPLVPWPTELFSTDAPLSKSCLIYGDIFNQKSINLIPLAGWPTLHILHCFVFFADPIGKRSHWGFDPSPYPSITTHASVPPYSQSQGLSVTGKFFRSE